jgi:hypothetical protein
LWFLSFSSRSRSIVKISEVTIVSWPVEYKKANRVRPRRKKSGMTRSFTTSFVYCRIVRNMGSIWDHRTILLKAVWSIDPIVWDHGISTGSH